MYGNDFMRYKEIRDALNHEVLGGDVVDVVNHPSHYTQSGIQAIDAIKAAVATAPPVQAVFVANILKYVWRYREKNGKQDLMKARWYLDALIQEVESKLDNAKS